jgi:hypothetical protein
MLLVYVIGRKFENIIGQRVTEKWCLRRGESAITRWMIGYGILEQLDTNSWRDRGVEVTGGS